MNIFIIGPSRSGKTTLANSLKEKGYNHIQASKLLKSKYPISKSENYIDYVKRLSNLSKIILENNPNFFIDYIKSNITNGINVIEGIRNPRDFCYLYDPNIDKVIITQGETMSDFESLGIDSIISIIKFWKKDFNYYNYKQCKFLDI